ncbi:hypothetical protein J4Q44_G00350050 [Coregonus suidteri]|uniref:Uncharacterized protein n=1 Tax=Coregonus suidteri TaxID=861788 RepID=A0AAN8KY68_9TELE
MSKRALLARSPQRRKRIGWKWRRGRWEMRNIVHLLHVPSLSTTTYTESSGLCITPVQCYDKFSWMTFLKYSDETLAVFKSFKLDDMQASKSKLEEMRMAGGDHVYFAKFLTSEKVMDLQLSDSNFRRHILLQYLILFQYLKGQVKFKSSSWILNDDQCSWMEETTYVVYQNERHQK